jgi:hypothetical protein
MRLLFNHHISGAADTIELMKRDRTDIYVIATHERRDSPIRLAADRFLQEPDFTRALTPDAYADWLLAVACSQRADVIVPYRRRDELAQFRDVFSEHGIRLLCASDAPTMRLLEDKPKLLTRMEALGVPTTPFRLFSGLEEYASLRIRKDIFPDHPGALCVKPALGIYGSGFRILRDELSETAKLSSLSNLELPEPAFRAMLASLRRAEQMMLMPLLPGPERSVDFACFEGRLLGTVTRMKTLTSQRLDHDPIGENLAALVARTFKLTGVLNLQTMEDASGTPRLLEVNSRTSGGIGMTGLTNVNLPGRLLDALNGLIPETPARVEGSMLVGRREIFWDTEGVDEAIDMSAL